MGGSWRRVRPQSLLASPWGVALAAGVSCCIAFTVFVSFTEPGRHVQRSLARRAQSVSLALEELYRGALGKASVAFEGTQALSNLEVTKLLPLEKSIPWWWLHLAEVRASVEAHPMVSRATLEMPSWFSPGQFVLTITEHAPAAFLLLDDRSWWVVGKEGQVLTRVESEATLSTLSKAYRGGVPMTLPVIRGIAAGGIATAQVESRLRYMVQSLSLLAQELGLKVRLAHLEQNGELRVWFEDFSFPAVFEEAATSPDYLKTAAARFRRVIKELGSELAVVTSIDLAFNKVAVVKGDFSEPELAE